MSDQTTPRAAADWINRYAGPLRVIAEDLGLESLELAPVVGMPTALRLVARCRHVKVESGITDFHNAWIDVAAIVLAPRVRQRAIAESVLRAISVISLEIDNALRRIRCDDCGRDQQHAGDCPRARRE